MKSFCLITLLAVTPLLAIAGNNEPTTPMSPPSDSVKTLMIEQAALMYPMMRQFSITHEENGVGEIRSKLNGNDFSKSDFRSTVTKINFNIPIFKRGNNGVSMSIGGIHREYEVSNVRNYNAQNSVFDSDLSVPMLSAGLSYMRNAILFGKNVTFTGVASGIFTPSFDQSQFTFTGLALVPFIQRPYTRLSVGAVLLLNPASPVPIFFMATYYHKFKACDLDLMIDMPYRIALRKQMGRRTSLSFVSELGGTNSFFEFNHPMQAADDQKLILSSLDIKTGLLAEYRLTRKAVLSLNAGANYIVNDRIRKNNDKPKDYFFENMHKPVPFVQVGLSLLPFWKGLNL